MPIPNIQCNCGYVIELLDSLAGQSVRCPRCKTKYRVSSHSTASQISPFSWNHLDSMADLGQYGPTAHAVRDEIPTRTVVKILLSAVIVVVLLIGSVVIYDTVNQRLLVDPKAGQELNAAGAEKLNNELFEVRSSELRRQSKEASAQEYELEDTSELVIENTPKHTDSSNQIKPTSMDGR